MGSEMCIRDSYYRNLRIFCKNLFGYFDNILVQGHLSKAAHRSINVFRLENAGSLILHQHNIDRLLHVLWLANMANEHNIRNHTRKRFLVGK